ncbi:hypothetical protein QYF36_003387 [Acer negundo]|nr:hypothetical protein QYF36_003387 [Acer negundo]
MFFYGFVLLAFALFLGLPFPGALFVFFAPIVAFTGGCVVVSSVNTKRCRVNRNEPNNESRNESASEEDCADGRGEDIGMKWWCLQLDVGSGTMDYWWPQLEWWWNNGDGDFYENESDER